LGQRSRLLALIWAYVGEMVLAAIVVVAAWRFVPSASLLAIVADASGAWTAVLSACAGLAVAVFLGFYAMTQNDFGVWLRRRRSFGVYALAFCVPFGVFVLALLVLRVVRSHTSYALVTVAAFYLLIYSAIMLITLLVNLYEFSVLALKFKEVSSRNNGSIT